MSNEPESYFSIAGAADDKHRIRRPMSDLAELEATLDEIEGRQAGRETMVTTHDQLTAMAPTIWANYRRGKGTPIKARSK
jgi:hypothetical protein